MNEEKAWVLHVPMKPPNLNDHRVNRAGGKSSGARAAFAAQAARYRKARGQWVVLLRNQKQISECPDATAKRRVLYVRIMGPREKEWDYDNLVGGGKMVFDAMIGAGLPVDDSSKWSDRENKQERGAESGLRVEVTDL